MQTENLSTLKIYKLTKEQYDARVASGDIEEYAMYLTPKEEIDLAPYATKEELTTKADAAHNHDTRYYTETEVDSLLLNKANASHNHDSVYDAKGSASNALTSAKTYADEAAVTAANTVKNDLLNGAGAAYDTLKELGDLIDTNTDAIEALETVAAGKANASHTHAIADVTNLQSTLDAKATQTDLDSHAANTTLHITSTERTNWNAAKTHADSAHAPSNAEKNQNAFSNIVVGSTTVAADSATDTVTFVGSNVTITPDSTNDKITFAVADGSTSTKGIVQLTNSTSSTSTTTAATPNSVKSAYDLANTANTAATTAQDTADAKVPLTRTVNGKALSANITLAASDVNAYSKTEIDEYVFITTDDIDEICGQTIVNAAEVTF